MQKRIAILGSTGSIGTQALEVISQHSDIFEVEALTAFNNVDLLIEQSLQYQPNMVVIGNEQHYEKDRDALESHPIKVFCGADAIGQVCAFDTVDMVLTAMVGFSGLKPTIEAIRAGKSIALANKETLVVAGELIMKEAAAKRVPIIPVDSEHSAIYQCLVGEGNNRIEKILLTASGGPFRKQGMEELKTVSPEQALRHPNWSMGPKITIDSATLMNKGLEVIEARWLFGVKPEEIEVVVHPQSIIHSMVQFADGSIKAQMGLPDMRLPIQYAFSYPDRFKSNFERFDFLNYPSLTFEKPDTKIFRNLALSYEALKVGGNWPCILNAANEVAVEAFLKEKIGFLEIPDLIESTLDRSDFIKAPELEDYYYSDLHARRVAQEQI
jgi:1-deoxy-D-xylulose-5-phosphate reductoisomerase